MSSDTSQYCVCSNETFEQIADKQRLNPLPFDEMLRFYTGCLDGCGTCIEDLRGFAIFSSPVTHSVG